MTRLRDLRDTQEHEEPSSCLGPFGDPGPRVGRGGGRAGDVHVSGGERGKVLLECTEN